MNVLQAIILGLVQGLTEFLPVSSSGHLVVIEYLMNIKEDQAFFMTIMLHFGTLVSLVIVYFKDIVKLAVEFILSIRDLIQKKSLNICKNETRKLCYMIIVTSIPTVIIGLVFKKVFMSFYSSLLAVGIGLLITSAYMYVADIMNGKKDVKRAGFKDALIVGIFQGIAIVPGISRSGSTIFGGLFSKMKKDFAVKYAFLVSLPVILGSFILELPDAIKNVNANGGLLPIFVGMIVAGVSGYFAIKMMIGIVKKRSLKGFMVYTAAFGTALILYSIMFT